LASLFDAAGELFDPPENVERTLQRARSQFLYRASSA
jgi:hypothetical protein